MTSDAVLNPDLVERVQSLKVHVDGAVAGIRSGVHRSPHRGASVIFAEHRDYRPGDDTRLLDWRAFARNDRYTVKHFEQEAHLRAHLLLDVSPSMAYGQGVAHKRIYGATLLGALALILLRQGDSVGAMLIHNGVHASSPSRARADHLGGLLELFATSSLPQGQTGLQRSLLESGERLGKRGLVVLASDLLDPEPDALRPLSLLRAQGHEVWVFHILHQDERELPFDGPLRVTDPEQPGHLDVDTSEVRSAYRERIGAFIDQRQAQCQAAGCRYRFVPTERPAHEVLNAALSGRSQA